MTPPEISVTYFRRGGQAISAADVAAQRLAAYRIREHQAGGHTYGNMRRDCPLCVQGSPS